MPQDVSPAVLNIDRNRHSARRFVIRPLEINGHSHFTIVICASDVDFSSADFEFVSITVDFCLTS